VRERVGTLDRKDFSTLLDLLLEPSPAMHVRIVLREYRRRGWPFEQAWAQALRTLPRSAPGIKEWRRTLHRSKERWRECYEEGAWSLSTTTSPSPLTTTTRVPS